MNPSCEFARARLSRFLDGELPPDEAARVRAHLATCDQCAAALASLRRADRLAREGSEDGDEASFEALRRSMRSRFDLAAAARLREQERPSPMTAEEVARAPLEPEVMRRAQPFAPFWRWLGIGVPIAAAAVFAFVMLVHEPAGRHAAPEAPVATKRIEATKPAPEAAPAPAPAPAPAASPAPAAERPAAPAAKTWGAPPPAAPPAQPRVSPPAAPEPARAMAEATPAPDPWPAVAAIVTPSGLARDQAGAVEHEPGADRVALLVRAEQQLTSAQAFAQDRAPSLETKDEKASPLRNGLAASQAVRTDRRPVAAPAAAARSWLAIGDAWYALLHEATADSAAMVAAAGCTGQPARACFASQALAAYRNALQAGDAASLSPDEATRARERSQELLPPAGAGE